MKLIKKNNKGFSLVELILVLGLSSLIFLGVLSMEKRRTETLRAEAAGQQIEEVGKALSSYIANQRAILSSSIASNTTVTLPLTVLQGVTSGSFPGKQYLPLSFNPQNAFGTGYRLQIRNNGGDALTGIVITDAAVVDETGAVRYDWLGYAARVAGAQSGMSFFSGAQVTGLNAGWTIPNTQFTAINAAGQLAYRSQYQGNSDDIYLRRDGLYPMTGDLNMGNHNIRDATDINFNGFLNGNNALLNNLQSGYIANNGNIDNAGNITNRGNIQNNGNIRNEFNIATRTLDGIGQSQFNGGDYARFSVLHSLYNMETPYINRDSGADVTIGNGNTGRLITRDVLITGGANGRVINRWVSDLLPTYSSRGIESVNVDIVDGGGAYRDIGKPTCSGGGTPKIEVIPQNVWVQEKVQGTITLNSSAPDAAGNSQLTIVQDQYAVGGFEAYAQDGGTFWRVRFNNPRYNYGLVGGRALAHKYCDYGM